MLFRSHVESCPSCKRYTTEMQQILSVLCSVKQPEAAPPPDFTNQVMSRLRQEEAATSERRFLRIPLRSLAMAASMLFLLGMNNLVVSNYVAGRFVKPNPGSEIPATNEPVVDKSVIETPAPSVPVVDKNIIETPVPLPDETVTEVPVEPDDVTVAVVSEEPVYEIAEIIEPVEIDPVVTTPPVEEPVIVAPVPKPVPRTVVLNIERSEERRVG